MYSDDPGKAGEAEKEITNEILSFAEKYKDEEFGISQFSENIYKIYSKSEKYYGIINLGKETKLIISEVK